MNGNAVVAYTGGAIFVVGVSGIAYIAFDAYFGENAAAFGTLVVFGILVAVLGQETDSDETDEQRETDDEGRELPRPGENE